MKELRKEITISVSDDTYKKIVEATLPEHIKKSESYTNGNMLCAILQPLYWVHDVSDKDFVTLRHIYYPNCEMKLSRDWWDGLYEGHLFRW